MTTRELLEKYIESRTQEEVKEMAIELCEIALETCGIKDLLSSMLKENEVTNNGKG